MPTYNVQWSQPATVTATVTVDLDELAQWAADAGVATLQDGEVRTASAHMLRSSLEQNHHLRDHLLRLWAAAHA